MNGYGSYDQLNGVSLFLDAHPIVTLLVLVGCIAVVATVFFLFFSFIGKRLFPNSAKKMLQKIFFVSASLFLGLIVGFIAFVFLIIFVLPDRDSAWWRIEEPARRIADNLRYYHRNGSQFPSSQNELEKLFPTEMSFLEENSRVKYISDDRNSFFVLFVRPSKYFVVIFTSDPRLVFGRYALDSTHKNTFPSMGNLYPPKILGPWDQLPE